MDGIIIGKRITFAQIVMGFITALAFIWDAYNPDSKLPAGVVSVVSQAIVGVGQTIIVNKFGVTTK